MSVGSFLSLNESYEQRVIRFVAERIGRRVQEVHGESRLSEDLGIDGDDAADLLSQFAETFAVDMTHFEFSKYFRSEGLFATVPLRFGALTIQDLIRSAAQKRFTTSNS